MKKYHHHAKKTALAAMVALALSSTGVFAAELPVNGEVVAGQVTVGDKTYVPVGANQQKVYINPATGQTFTVVGNSVIDWSTFDIGSGKSLTFEGQGSNYILNRVSGSSASEIYGILNTQNIHFILANPNGITVGNGAQLNVIDGGSILLAAMGAGFNNANNSITLQNYNYGDGSAINIGGIEAINGNVALMAKTINVADGITFSGDTALKLLAGETLYNQPITVTPGEGVDSIGSSGSITFNGSLVDDSHKVNLGVSADTITMSADKEIALTRADSAVNIRTGSLQNADITGPVVTLVRDGAITVSDSKLTSTVGDIKVLSGTLSEDGKTLSNTTVTNNNYIVNHKVTMNNSSVISADDAIIAAAAVDISGKKAGESAAIAAVNDVFIASGKNVPLQSGSLTTDAGMNTAVTVSNAEIQGRNLTLAGNDVTVTSSSELTATNDMQIVAAPNMTVSNGKVVSGQNSTTSNGGVEITDSVLQGKNISLTGIAVTASGTIGNASTEKVHLLAGRDFDFSADSMTRGMTANVTGGTITGHDILAEGATVEVANGAAIHAVSAVENEETVAGKVRLLAGSGVINGVVTATSGNKATVKGTLSGGDIVVAGGAVEVDGGTVDVGTNSAWLLAGNSIKTTAATGSVDADGVITSAEGNAVTIKKGAAVSADKVHIAGYSADLSSATNNSRITAAEKINAVTGSTINNNAGTLVREANAARGRFSRDTASVVTVNGSASSAMIDMPTDGRVISGSVSYKGNSYDASSNYYFNLASGDTITANSHSIINWNTFDIGLSGVLNFDTSNGALLNRVTGSYASWLQGTLNHTGTYPLLLVNPQGIHVYQGATINGANLILSGLDMTDTALSNFSTAGAVAYDTASTGDVNLESGITFSNEAEKLALAGREVTVAQNTLKAESLKIDATNTATLTNLAYTGALVGNSVLGSDGGSLTLSGGSYTGNTNLKGTTVNMAVTSHTGDVTVQGTAVGINGGTYTGDLTLAGTSVSVSGATFNGEDKAHDLTLSGLGENGAVTVSNSTVTGADDVVLTGKTVNVSQSGNTRADWTAETFTLGKGESASNTTGITNINLTVTKADTTPTVGNDVALTLNNTAISAPQINLTPASLILSGGSSLKSNTTVDIASAGSVDVQGASTVKATAGDLNIGADGALTVQGGSNVTAETGDLNVTAAGALTVKGGSTLEAKTGNLTAKGASVAIGVANDTENTIKADAGNITIKAGEDDGRTDANTVNIQNTDLTANAAGKSITVTGYSVEAAGDLHTKTATMSGNSVNTAGTIAADTVNITGTASASASGTITADAVNMSGADSVYASGNITADTLNITGISATGSLTVGGVVHVANALTLQGGSSGKAAINGAITAPSITISAQDVTFSGANVTAATGDVSVTGKTIRTYESYYTSSAINSENGDVLLISGTNTAGVYTTTEGGSISADKMNITGDTVTALARTTSIENGTIHADNMQIAAANTVNGSTWAAGFGDTDNPNNLTLTNTTVLSKNGEGAIENVKLAGSNVTFGGGGTDAQAFKANSLAVASDQSITVASGQVNVTGAAGISLSGKSITVDGTIQARQINLTATENDATLNSGSALNATGEDATNAISITANNGNINANGSLTADDSITMNAKTNIATAGTITAATVGMTAENDIGTAGTITADSVSLAAGNDINSAADITASTITMDGGDGKAISATGALNAAGGTITLGHAPSDEPAKAGTKTVTIGPAAGANKAVQAQTVNVHATDTIGLSRVTMETADSLNLASKEVSITGSSVTTEGSLTLNGTEDAANPSVSITGSTLAGTAVNATGKGISVGSSDLTATTGGIAVNSTGENYIAVTNTALKAEHATNGNISINSGKAIQAIGGSMTAGKDISLAAIAAKGGEDSDAAYAIKASANMTAGYDIGLTATAGEVYSAGSLTATSGSITMDSADSSKISMTGDLAAASGTVTLGHADGEHKTGIVEINSGTTDKGIKATTLLVNATEEIGIQSAAIDVNSALHLGSKKVSVASSNIATDGVLTLASSNSAATITGSTLEGTSATVSGKGISVSDSTITAATGGITAVSNGENNVAVTNTVLTANNATNGNISINSGKAIQAIGGSMTAGKDISLAAVAAKGGEGSDAVYAIKASANMTAGNDIGLTATAGEVYSAGSLTATAGDLALDSAGGAKITAIGGMLAESGSITLGHAAGNEVVGTAAVELGPVTEEEYDTENPNIITIKSSEFSINATDAITIQNANVLVTGANGIDLSSGTVSANGSRLHAAQGDVSIDATGDIEVGGNGSVYAENGNITIHSGNAGRVDVSVYEAFDSSIDYDVKAKNINVKGASVDTSSTRWHATGGNLKMEATGDYGEIRFSNSFKATGTTNANDGNITLISKFGIVGNYTGMTADNDITFTTNTGILDIGRAQMEAGGNVALNSGTRVYIAGNIKAENGNIGIEAKKGDIDIWRHSFSDPDEALAAKNINITADDGKITVNSVLSAEKDISINAIKGEVSASSKKTAEKINIEALGRVYSMNDTASEEINITSKEGNVEVGNLFAPSIEVTASNEKDKEVSITVLSGWNIKATAPDGNITLAAENGTIDVKGNLIVVDDDEAKAGSISLTTGAESAKGTILIGNEGMNTVSAKTITVDAPKSVTLNNAKIETEEDLLLTSAETQITDSILTTTGGNLTVKSTGTDITVDKSTITGNSVAINGKGIQVGQAELENNTSTITANTGDVTLTTDTDIEVSKATITAKGKADLVAATGINVADTGVKATDKGISIESTAADSDVTLTSVTLKAENATAGNITVQTGNAIGVTGGSMTVGKDITLKAENAGITVSGTMLTNKEGNGGNIDLLAGSEGTNGWSATENNALGLTNVTLSAAGVVTGKSGKTDIATSSITAGGNVNVTTVGTDGDASHVNVDKSTIAGAGITISGKGIQVGQAEMENNNSTITANTSDVTLTTDTNIAVNNANITAKGKAELVAVNGINVADTSVTATDKGISITSMAADSDVTLTSVTLNAENATYGNITVQTGNAIGVTGGSMTAGKDITLKTENAGITVSDAALTTIAGNGGNIDLLAGSEGTNGWSAIENNALGLTNVTFSVAGAVTAKSGKTDIATSSITAGGNVNVTAVGTDGDASHVNVDKSTITGAGVAISGKGIQVGQAEVENNNSTITANAGDVALTTDTNIAVSKAAITAKGKTELVAVNGINVADTSVTATDKGISITSTAADSDVTLTSVTLKAENATVGNITVQTGNAIGVTGGSMTAGKDITLKAENAGITVSDAALTTIAGNGGNIDWLAGSEGTNSWSATENNALGLTNITLNAAGAVTAKSGKTDIATSSITAGGNVNVTTVGTDGDASHVNVDKSTIAGAGVAISGKGIKVDQAEMENNNSTITANTGDVTLTTDTNIAVNNANITAKGKADLVAATGINVADTGVTATDKGISIESTAADSDVTLTSVTLKAENATAGNITVQTGNAIGVTGGSMIAGKDITLKTENAGITVSDAALTTIAGNGGNIDLLAGSVDGTGWSATENNALGLTNVTLSGAGAVTGKSGKTDIATSSITAGGNVNVTAVGTDGDASHVNVDKSTIAGAGVAISGKGIQVDQAEMENNNSTITANTGDVTLTTDTNIAVNNANITAKGKADLVAATGINVANTSVTATDKGISIESTAADSDVTLTSVALNAENATYGNITVQTGNAIGVTGGSMIAGKDITLKAENAGITVSDAALTTIAGNGGNIDLLAGSEGTNGWSAIENNALGLTNVTFSVAGAVTAKSGKTDIATSSITAGGNVNVTTVGTDDDASHVNVDKSTIAGAGVAISGKGIQVGQAEMENNNSTITANTGDVTLTTDTNIAVNNANITAKGKADLVAATGINVANTSVTATDKGITIISTSDGKDLILTNTTLTATNATDGSITVRAKNAVNTKGSSLTAGNGLTINAENAANELESSTLQGKNVNISGVGITVSKSEGTGAAAPSVTATAGNVALNSTAGIGVSDASITANIGGISVISTDANSDVTLTNAAMTAGAAIEINSGKALNVSEGSMTADNNIGLVAASAAEVGNSKLQGKNVSISGKGITVSDNDAVTPTIKATAGGVTLTSTGDGNDVTLTGATLKADNTTSGNITITSARAIEATGGSMTAGENINLAATSSDGSAGAKAVNSSSDMTAGGNVCVASVAGDVVSSGNVAAANITIDGDNVSATGSLDAENGTITLGHAEGTGNVVIGEAADAAKVVKAANLNVHATDSIATRNANIAVTNNVALASEAISMDGTALTTGGSLDIKGDTIAINASTLRTTNTSNGHINLLAGNADGAGWSAGDGNTLALTNTDVSAAGDVSFRAGQITINADAENAPVKEIRGNNLLLAAAKSYDAENHEYIMESGQTISVTNTNLTGSDSITLLGYKTNIKGDVISKRLLGAVGESVTMNEDGSDVDAYTYTQEEGANVLTVDGAVATSDESDLIYIKLYGDAKFLNKNDTLQTMSFIANSPYSLAISGDMTVTAESGIRLASESIQIQDNLWANNPNASIELASAGGEMNISGNLRAGKDVILKSAQNIVIGTDYKTVSVTADNGSVKLLAGNFDGRYGAQGEWVSANPEVNGIVLNNTAIAAGENIIVKGGAVNFTGNNELAGAASVLAESAVLSGTVSGAANTQATLTMTADNIVVESGTLLTMDGFATRQGDFTLKSTARIRAAETDLQGETISLANNSLVVGDAVKVKAENAELAGLIYTDKLTAKADNTLTVTEAVTNKAGTGDTIVELEGSNVTFVGSSFKTLTVKGTESITLDEGDLHGENDIALTTKNLTVATNITTTNGDINLTGTENLRVTGSLTAGQQIGLNGKNIQLSGAKLNNGANAKTTVAGESAVITGTITTDTGADLSVKAQNVIVGDSGTTNIAVSKFTVEGVEQAKFINTNFQADTTVKGKAAVLTGNINATGHELTLQSTNVTIGDGQTATVMTAKSLADADNLTIDQAVLNLDSYKLQAGKAITLKNEVTAEGQALELAAPDASIGDGSANTVIKAGSVSATDKLLVDKAVLAVDDGTLQAQQIILRGNVSADNLDLTLQAPEAAIGDGIVDTVITARSVMGTEDLLIDKASFAVTNPIIATAGNLTLQHEIVAGDTVGFQAGKAITMQGMSMDKSTDVSFEGKLIDMRGSSIDAGKDGKLFFAAYSVKTESPLSYTFQPDNEVIIDNSRLDAGEMSMLGYSIIARNGAEIYADKTLDALAAKKVAMGNLGNLEIVSQATMSNEPQNKLLQQDAIIEVGGRAYHNFRFIPASAYQSDTIMRYLESVNEMPWQIGSDNSPLSIIGIPGLSLYRFQYRDGISDAISGLEMYFTVEPHEGAVREEKEKTNE